VSAFDEQLHTILARLGVDVAIRETPYGVPMTTPFRRPRHASYDHEFVERYWHILDWTDGSSRSSPAGTAARRACTSSGTRSTSR
jgi:hypothetical protein